jgi:hypothetical protein
LPLCSISGAKQNKTFLPIFVCPQYPPYQDQACQEVPAELIDHLVDPDEKPQWMLSDNIADPHPDKLRDLPVHFQLLGKLDLHTDGLEDRQMLARNVFVLFCCRKKHKNKKPGASTINFLQ